MPTLPTPDAAHDDLGFVPSEQSHADIGFEPDPAPDIGIGRSAVSGLAHGAALGFGDKMVAGWKSLLKGTKYEKELAGEEATTKAEEEANPGTYAASKFVGSAVPAFAMGPASSITGLALQSGALGAAQGLGESKADDFTGKLRDAGIGGGVGFLAGGLGGGAVKSVGDIASIAGKSAFPYLERLAITTGRKALSGGGAISVAKPLSDDAVREALASGAIKPFGTVTGAAERLGNLREGVGDQYGKIVAYLESAGIKGPEAHALATNFLAEGAARSANTMNPAIPHAFESAAEQIASKPVDATGHLGLTQAENMKRSLQDMARSSYRKLEPGEVGEAHESLASMLRQANEDAIDRGVKASGDPALQAVGSAFVPVKHRLGNIIEASNMADQAAARAARNRSVSLTDTIAALGGLARGSPGEAMALAGGNNLLRTRGASTMAATASTAAKLARLAQTNPAAAGKFAAPLTQAAARGADALAATHFTLSQDPAYQELMHANAEGDQ